jgi:hypothetical protein
MPMVNTIFEEQVDKLYHLLQRVAGAFSQAGIEYEVIGGMAVLLQVQRVDPDAGRLTKDIDFLVRRRDLERIATAVEPYGFRLRHVAGIDMIVDAEAPSARRAVHLVFSGEKVRTDYLESTPPIEPGIRLRDAWIAPVADLVRMKLTSYRLKDRVHIQDLDEVGLITPEIEAGLSDELRKRLAEVRATE